MGHHVDCGGRRVPVLLRHYDNVVGGQGDDDNLSSDHRINLSFGSTSSCPRLPLPAAIPHRQCRSPRVHDGSELSDCSCLAVRPHPFYDIIPFYDIVLSTSYENYVDHLFLIAFAEVSSSYNNENSVEVVLVVVGGGHDSSH